MDAAINFPDNPNRLLVIDDDQDVAQLFAKVGEKMGFESSCLSNGRDLSTALESFAPSVVIMDLKMPDCGGMALLRQMREANSSANLLLASGLDSRALNTAEELGSALGLNVIGALHKPFAMAELRGKLATFLDFEKPVDRAEFVAALQTDDIYVEYQPKLVRDPVDDEWRVSEVEALVRWRRNGNENVSPEKFIPLCDEFGLLPVLTEKVLRQALAQIKAWDQQNINLSVSVNIAPSMLDEHGFAEQILAIVRNSGVQHSRLNFEITETGIMRHADLAEQTLNRLRDEGFRFSVDDFGTGNSSLHQLYQLPFNELKIDRSFVMDIDKREDAKIIVEASIMLGQKLGMSVCAEGVESLEAFSFLKAAGCDTLQGYLISRPIEADFVVDIVEQWAEEAKPSRRSLSSCH